MSRCEWCIALLRRRSRTVKGAEPRAPPSAQILLKARPGGTFDVAEAPVCAHPGRPDRRRLANARPRAGTRECTDELEKSAHKANSVIRNRNGTSPAHRGVQKMDKWTAA